MTSVLDLPPKKPLQQGEIPTHWLNERATRFQNPWDSWCSYPPQSRILPYLIFTAMNPTYPDPDKVPLATVRTPRWGEDQKEEMKGKIKSTWLGHACFLLELPAQSTTQPRGPRILFDPVFGKRCSSSQLVGPKRYTPAPCAINDIPDVDAIVISHDHYDHMDADTLKSIFKRERKPLVFAPLGNAPFLKSVRAPEKNIHVMDWWQSKHVKVEVPADDGGPFTLSFDITCTPCQHFTGRHLFDDYTTLWSSWVVQSPSPSQSEGTAANSNKIPTSTAVDNQGRDGVQVYFAGDTGYRTVKEGEDENKVPTCPAFKEIGEVFGGFDFAMIPIGAYEPRKVMSPIHCAPQDSVRIFQDVRARKALGMHWGTWVLTTEAVDEPPKKLAEECEKAGIPDDDFVVCDIGETRFW